MQTADIRWTLRLLDDELCIALPHKGARIGMAANDWFSGGDVPLH
jgi:hypothetical protein